MELANTPDDDLLDASLEVPEHVVYRSFEAETLLLNLETGQYHGLNQTGGRILELLKETGGSLRDAIRALADEYGTDPAEIEGDLVDFCRALAQRGLVNVSDGPA